MTGAVLAELFLASRALIGLLGASIATSLGIGSLARDFVELLLAALADRAASVHAIDVDCLALAESSCLPRRFCFGHLGNFLADLGSVDLGEDMVSHAVLRRVQGRRRVDLGGGLGSQAGGGAIVGELRDPLTLGRVFWIELGL